MRRLQIAIIIALAVCAHPAQAEVYTLNPFVAEGGYAVSLLSGSSSGGFSITCTNAPADTRIITSSALGNGRTLAEGESVVLTFTASSTQLSTLSLGFGWGFDFGTNIVIYTADTGVPTYTFHVHQYHASNGFPFITGTVAAAWVNTPLPVSTSYLMAGNSVAVTTTLTRVDLDTYQSSVQWGGQAYTSSFTCASDPSINTIFFRSGASSSPGLAVNDNYTISSVSLSFSANEASVITMDGSADLLDAANNNVTAGRVLYPTVEEGSALIYTNESFLEAGALVKASYASRKAGGLGFDFTLPARTAGVPYPTNSPKDRLETVVWDDISLSHVTATAHYTGFSIKIPSGMGLVTNWFLFHQWHQSSPESPPIAMELLLTNYARLGVAIRYGANKSSGTWFYLQRTDNGSDDRFIDLPRNKWIDFIIRWKFDVSGTNGCAIVYRHDEDWTNAVQIFNYTGRIGYTNVIDGDRLTEKIGIYRAEDYSNSHTILYDQIRVGHGYSEVAPWQ